MANPEHVAILQQGVVAWNKWRKTREDLALDLSAADLRGRDLTSADLRGANLSNAVLRNVRMGKGTLLWDANLANADLYASNLCGADLQEAKFNNADLFQADLRETNLQGADLSTARGGLLSKQLAGSDLTGAKLPEPLAKVYDSLSSVKEISDSAQKLFLALLAGCLYSWLTIAQTTDVELITNRASTPLPIIQAAIPIVGFYVVTPLILLCLYFYFHFYLQKLWEELGSLPAVFPDGRLLHNRTDPWLLNDLVRSHFAKLKDGRPFLSYFQAWVSVVLAWWLVPITLFLFWGRFLRRHDLFGTIVHALILALAIFSAVRLYCIAGEALRGEERMVFHWKEVLSRRSIYMRFLFISLVGALLIVISLGAIFGEPYWQPDKSWMQLQTHSPRTWVPWLLDRAGYYPFANLKDADVSVKPPNWTGKKDEELDLVKGANLQNSDMRYASAQNAFFVKAQLWRSNLRGANLDSADLRQSNLMDADLREALLTAALIQGANMVHARLDDARLDQAHLSRAYLNSASIRHANLAFTDLSGAHLIQADLRDADLGGAKLAEADLRGALLTGAKFGITFPDVPGLLVNGPVIKYADLRNTRGLTPEAVLKCSDWAHAFFDRDMLKQLGLPAEHNEKLQKQMEAEQQAKAAAATAPTAPIAKP